MSFEISSMLNPDVYDHPVDNIELIETHISWVVLTGDFAYKIKKPVNFGFLDFSTLEKRRICCEQELHLNRRLAAAIYLDVVSISGTVDKPVITITGEGFEFAVKMLQFPQSAQLDHMLSAGQLKIEHMDAIALMVADFHRDIPVTDEQMMYGNGNEIYSPVTENFTQINKHINTRLYEDDLLTLKRWSTAEFSRLESVFEQRKADGFIRECHGDMHLRNMIWLDDKPLAFDCIEFSLSLRWIDVISEVAFLVMDLQDRKQFSLANRFVNSYLEITGDYAGLMILPFYLCYRALVRAKVSILQLEQKSLSEQEKNKSKIEFASYLELANSYTRAPKPKLVITRGMSASGKSTLSKQLVDTLGMIRIRSDVERKRLFSIDVSESALGEINSGVYSAKASKQTYEKLLELAEHVIKAGYSVIIDAAFLKYEQREPFEQLAIKLDTPYIILELTAEEEVLRQRIIERKNDVSDADLSVLEYQLSNWRALQINELANMVSVQTDLELDINNLIHEVDSRSL